MKKQLLNLSFVAIALALYVASAVAAPVAPVNTMEIPGTATALTIDGIAEDVYSPMQATGVFNPTGYDGESDFTLNFQVAYDPTYLYLYCEVSDDVNHSFDAVNGDPWTFDNIELFLQLDSNTAVTAYDSGTIQLRFNRGFDTIQTPGRATQEEYELYIENETGSGWLIEVAVPWTAVLWTGALPEDIMTYVDGMHVLGFDVSGADSDNADGDAAVGNRDVQTAWDMDDPADEADRTEDLAWNNTSVFGFVTLQNWWLVGVDNYTESNMNAYPNPATDHITFDVEGDVNIEIYSITGSLVMTSNVATVDVSALSSGIYVALINNESVRFTVK